VSRVNGAVWHSGTLGSGTSIRGIPWLHAALASAPATGATCDVDRTGTGWLIVHTPLTWTAATTALDAAFPATAYDVPSEHVLALVLDTKDPRYLDANSGLNPIIVTGPSWVDLPLK
jgi:hypothetical protein